MTGYTVHTGTTLKFSAGWDRIFETGAKSGQGAKPESAKSGKKSQAAKHVSTAAAKKARGAKRAAKRK